MMLTDARWHPSHNRMVVICECGETILHWANRWTVRCLQCGRTDDLERLRHAYVNRNAVVRLKEPVDE